MTQPTAYSRSTGFQQEETDAVAGRSTVRTAMVDAEYDAIATTLSQVLANLAIIQRDDTALQDEIVSTESLSPQVKTLISTTGINPRGAWLTATAYAVKDVVETGTPVTSYICVTAHTSGTFATDRAAGKWMVLGQEPGVGTFTSITLTTGGVSLGTNNTQDLAATANRFRSGYFGTSVFAATSVVTPLVQSSGAVDLVFGANGGTDWNLRSTGKHWEPNADNTQNLASASRRVLNLFTGVVDSGTVGSLSLKTGPGVTGFEVSHFAAGVNFLGAQSSSGASATLYATGASAGININIVSKTNGSILLQTGSIGSAVTQFQVDHTASANRSVTITGSNGGNPTISTTAGSLAITPAVVIAGASLQVTPSGAFIALGDVPATSGEGLRLNKNSFVIARNNGNSANVVLAGIATVNSIPEVICLGADGSAGNASSGVIALARSKAGTPSTVDLPAGMWGVWRDTTGATTKVYYNNAGAIIASAAFA